MIGTMAAAGFIRAWWKPIGAVVLVAVVLLLVFQMGRNHANQAWERKHGAAVAEWNAERFKAADKARAAEAEARRIETAWRDHVAKREKEYRDEKAATDAARALERRDRDRLRDAVDHFVRAGQAAGGPGDACRDLRARLETLGALVKEADGLAGQCTAEVESLGSLVRLCRGYGDALRPAQ
jgi:hypothetical protein